MKIEIAHDSLAAKIYERVSVEEKTRRKVEKFIADRYVFFVNRNVLLSKDDLDYIHPYLDKIDIDEEQRIFVDKSRKALRKRQRILTAIVLAVFLAISTAALIAWNQRNIAIDERDRADRNAFSADSSAAVAKDKERIALEKEKIAENKTRIAVIQTRIAEAATLKAIRQEGIAEEKTRLEILARIIAEKATVEKDSALVREERAKDSEVEKKLEAIAARKEAVESERKAQESLKRAIAQTMSSKSLQVSDPIHQTLIALEAFRRNKVNKGPEYDPTIYNGLYFANKSLRGEDYYQLTGHTSAIRSIVFVSSGKQVYSTGSDGNVFRWKLNEDQVARDNEPLMLSRTVRRALAISDDNEWLIGGNDREPFLQIHNLKNGNNNFESIMGPQAAIWDLAFLPGRKKCFGSSEDGSIWYYDLAAKVFQPLLSLPIQIKSLAVSPKGTMLAGIDAQGKLYLWDIQEEKSIKRVEIGNEKNPHYESVSFNSDGSQLAVGDWNGRVSLWTYPEKGGKPSYELLGHTARVSKIVFSKDGKLMATASYDKRIQLWPIGKPGFERTLPVVLADHSSWIFSLAFSPKGDLLLSGDLDGVLKRWPTNPQLLTTDLCPLLTRNLNELEWELYVGKDIPYGKTCDSLP